MPFFTARFASATAKAKKAWREHSVPYNGLSYIPVCPRMMLVISEEAPYPAEVSAFTQIS
jgi:hypothetical protein